MKKYLLLLIALVAFCMNDANAQSNDTWLISLNKQVVLRSPAETAEPVVFISKSALQKGKSMLTIQYTTENGEKDWNRTFTFNYANEQTLKQASIKNQSGSISFAAKELLKAAQLNKPLFVYTTSLPNDPDVAALVRVRRILLCKIQWKK